MPAHLLQTWLILVESQSNYVLKSLYEPHARLWFKHLESASLVIALGHAAFLFLRVSI